jgi:hypothetical protein
MRVHALICAVLAVGVGCAKPAMVNLDDQLLSAIDDKRDSIQYFVGYGFRLVAWVDQQEADSGAVETQVATSARPRVETESIEFPTGTPGVGVAWGEGYVEIDVGSGFILRFTRFLPRSTSVYGLSRVNSVEVLFNGTGQCVVTNPWGTPITDRILESPWQGCVWLDGKRYQLYSFESYSRDNQTAYLWPALAVKQEQRTTRFTTKTTTVRGRKIKE